MAAVEIIVLMLIILEHLGHMLPVALLEMGMMVSGVTRLLKRGVTLASPWILLLLLLLMLLLVGPLLVVVLRALWPLLPNGHFLA